MIRFWQIFKINLFKINDLKYWLPIDIENDQEEK